MAMRVKKARPICPYCMRVPCKCGQFGKRFYFQAANGMHVSVRAPNGLLAVKSLPSWVLL